ncbi:MAG: family transposase [Rhodospirillales bacterium]|nr:family transposase [Rhodospirillales bacterium]
MEQIIIYVGLDVHKATIALRWQRGGKREEMRECGQNANTPTALKTLAAKLQSWLVAVVNCGFVTRPDRAATVSSDNLRQWGMTERWWLRHRFHASQAIGLRPTVGMRSNSPSCTVPVN